MSKILSHQDIVGFVREQFSEPERFIPLHEPRFVGKEREYVMDAIDSTFVSSVGAYVDRFEEMMKEITGAKYAIALVNGTAALQVALRLAGVVSGDEVISQSLTFIATANAISHAGAHPIFLDVDRASLGLSANALSSFLEEHCELSAEGFCINTKTKRVVRACVPMHTFGLACNIEEIKAICDRWNIALVEDAAESLGSYRQGKHTGTFGLLGTFSFNGNKTVTCGGGGAIVTDDDELGTLAKHLTTTAKVPHRWEYKHDHIGYNFRMPNLNAAMACAQLEQLEDFVERKRKLASDYASFFNGSQYQFYQEQAGDKSNYWLCAIALADRVERDNFLEYSNKAGVMTRPVWQLMTQLPIYAGCQSDGSPIAEELSDRLVNLPSSVRLEKV